MSVYVSTNATVGSGTTCTSTLTATVPGQAINTACPALAGARYISMRRTAGGYLALSELALYSASGMVHPYIMRHT